METSESETANIESSYRSALLDHFADQQRSASHRFFVSSRHAVFVVVVSRGHTLHDSRLEYWLRYIEHIWKETRESWALQEVLRSVRSGKPESDELRAEAEPVATEVRHYCWHLQHLGELSSLTDVLMVTLTQFSHYVGHVPEWCEVCAEFPGDIPFQGAPGGRAHFEEWLRRRGG